MRVDAAEAETTYRQIFEIRRRVLCPEHAVRLGGLNNLAHSA